MSGNLSEIPHVYPVIERHSQISRHPLCPLQGDLSTSMPAPTLGGLPDNNISNLTTLLVAEEENRRLCLASVFFPM